MRVYMTVMTPAIVQKLMSISADTPTATLSEAIASSEVASARAASRARTTVDSLNGCSCTERRSPSAGRPPLSA